MVDNEAMLREIKREMYQEIDELKREYLAFKKRISVLANLFIPGIGFVVCGSSWLKGLVSFVLFVLYNVLYFNVILPATDTVIAVIYYVPAVLIWIASAVLVASLD